MVSQLSVVMRTGGNSSYRIACAKLLQGEILRPAYAMANSWQHCDGWTGKPPMSRRSAVAAKLNFPGEQATAVKHSLCSRGLLIQMWAVKSSDEEIDPDCSSGARICVSEHWISSEREILNRP